MKLLSSLFFGALGIVLLAPATSAAPGKSTLPPQITERAVCDTLKSLWVAAGQMPAHFTVKAAPFEVLEDGVTGWAKLHIKAQVACQVDSFTEVKEVYNQSGKVFTLVRRAYSAGEIITIPVVVVAVVDGTGRLFQQAPTGRTPADWGRTLEGFRNGIDLATEKGTKLAAAPEEISKGERWFDEQRDRKFSFEMLIKALNEKRRITNALSAEAGCLGALYPDAGDRLRTINHPMNRDQELAEARRLQAEMEPIIRADYDKFKAGYDEVRSQVNAAKKLLNES